MAQINQSLESASASPPRRSGLAGERGRPASIKIESWRNDDADIWNSQIIPAFNKHYPDIKVEFSPPAPTEYNAALNARLAGGTAGDLITCRPFDPRSTSSTRAISTSLNDLRGMNNFSDVAKSAWTDRRRQDHVLRADGLGHPRLHLQQGRLEEGRRLASRRRWTSSTPCSTS